MCGRYVRTPHLHSHTEALSHTYTHTRNTTLALFANFLSVFGLFVCLFAHFMLSYARINNKKQKAHKVYTYMQTNEVGLCVCVCVVHKMYVWGSCLYRHTIAQWQQFTIKIYQQLNRHCLLFITRDLSCFIY